MITCLEKDKLLAFETKKFIIIVRIVILKVRSERGMVEGGNLRYKVSMGKGGGTMRGRVYISNAFSLGMLKYDDVKLRIKKINVEEVREIISSGFISAIGHASTAQILSEILGKKIEENRIQIQLDKDDILVVFQLLERLPEGKVLSREELEKINYKFYLVELAEKNYEEL